MKYDFEHLIKHHQELYYKGTPQISDEQFDALWDRLKTSYPDSELLKKVGDDRIDGFAKAKHIMNMNSQEKVNKPEDFNSWWKRRNIATAVVQHKLDGISVELQYENGNFVRAVTRGDGTIGDDISDNVRKMWGFRDKAENFSGAVRGEIVMFRVVFEEKFAPQGYKNPRNMASGLSKQKDGKGCENLTIVCYDVHSPSSPFTTEQDKMDWLRSNTFIMPFHYFVDDPDKVNKIRESINRSEVPYDIDGLVIKNNIVNLEDMKRDRPEKQIAFKFDSDVTVSVLTGVEWSRNGYNYTPVALIKEVELNGTVVKRASLANIDNIKKLGVKIGDTISIRKAGEIIPQITGVVDNTGATDITPPEKCYECGEPLRATGTTVTCLNNSCGGRLLHRVEKWLDTLDVKGWGPAMINHVMGCGVKSIASLYDDKVFEKAYTTTNLKVNTKKAFTNLYAIHKLPLEKILAGFDIRGAGEKVFKKLVDFGYDTVDKIAGAKVDELARIDGIGEITALIIVDGVNEHLTEINEVLTHIAVEKPADIVVDISPAPASDAPSFCFTGALSVPRSKAQEMVRNKGWIVKDGVGKGLTYLVIADPDSRSSKANKARTLGTKLISEEEFRSML